MKMNTALTDMIRRGRYEKEKPVTVIWHPFRRDEYFSKLRKGNIFGIIRELFRNLRRCHERIWKGYCDYDLFEIDTWFLGIMPNMLEEFRDMTNGYPSSFVGPDAEGITQEDKEEAEFAAWQGELSKMAFLLRKQMKLRVLSEIRMRKNTMKPLNVSVMSMEFWVKSWTRKAAIWCILWMKLKSINRFRIVILRKNIKTCLIGIGAVRKA